MVELHCKFCDLTGPGDHRPSAPLGPHVVAPVETRRVVPGPGLDPRIAPGLSNANLAVARHQGRVYLAFRSAPFHYATPQSRVHVVSSDDEVSWRWEQTLSLGADLREPQLLSLGSQLHLYVSELGTDRNDFEPKGVWHLVRAEAGHWSSPQRRFNDGRIVWRVRPFGDGALMTYYIGGGDIYAPLSDVLQQPPWETVIETFSAMEEGGVSVHLATSANGIDWTPLGPQPLHEGGASETDLYLEPGGTTVAVMRLELPEHKKAGSVILCGQAGIDGELVQTIDARKFDSPFVFGHEGQIYLLARRHLGASGAYVDDDVDSLAEYALAQARYACTRKRTSLWRWEAEDGRFAFVLDLPSRGDCCFPSALPGDDPKEWNVYDYSSPLNSEEDPRWCEGQAHVTHIYRHVLRFEASPGAG